MKYIVHKDNVSFWVDTCNKGLHIAVEKLKIERQYLQECIALNRVSTPHLFDTDKYDGLFDIKEYLQNAEGVDVGIKLDPQTQQYILECAKSFEEYVLNYNKNKDKVIP